MYYLKMSYDINDEMVRLFTTHIELLDPVRKLIIKELPNTIIPFVGVEVSPSLTMDMNFYFLVTPDKMSLKLKKNFYKSSNLMNILKDFVLKKVTAQLDFMLQDYVNSKVTDEEMKKQLVKQSIQFREGKEISMGEFSMSVRNIISKGFIPNYISRVNSISSQMPGMGQQQNQLNLLDYIMKDNPEAYTILATSGAMRIFDKQEDFISFNKTHQIANCNDDRLSRWTYDMAYGKPTKKTMEKISKNGNNFYKMLIRDTNDIKYGVSTLYENSDLMSNSYYVMDAAIEMKCLLGYGIDGGADVSAASHMNYLLSEYLECISRCSTIVFVVNVPNLYYDYIDQTILPKETQMIEKENQDINMGSIKLENDTLIKYKYMMKKHNLDYLWGSVLFDNNGCYDYTGPIPSLSLFQTFYNPEEKLEGTCKINGVKFEDIKGFYNLLIDYLKDTHKIVFAYTDTKAYKDNLFMRPFIKSENIIGLNNPRGLFTSKTRLPYFIKSSIDALEKKTNIQNTVLNAFTTDHDQVMFIDQIVEPLLAKCKKRDKSKSHIFSSITSLSCLIQDLFIQYINNGCCIENLLNDVQESQSTIQLDHQKSNIKTDAQAFVDRMKDIFDRIEDNDGLFIVREDVIAKVKHEEPIKADVSFDSIIGLKDVKEQLKRYTAYVHMNKYRSRRGFKTTFISKHMCFLGSPGTCKTTVARLLAKKLKSIGILKTDHIEITSRDKLVGRYVGWTAKNVQETVMKLVNNGGGILLVDEAYSLIDHNQKTFGQEAIDAFVNLMDDPKVRESVIIIFAGYPKEMKQFLRSNPGLPSRINTIIKFPNYNEDELVEIAKVLCANKGVSMDDGYIQKLRESIKKYIKRPDFGNGRFIRSILEKSLLEQSYRLYNSSDELHEEILDGELKTLTKDDFSDKHIFAELNIKKRNPIGFH